MSRKLIASFVVLAAALGTGLGAYAATGAQKAGARTQASTAHQYMAALQQKIPLPELASPAQLAAVISNLNGRFHLPNTQAKLTCSYLTTGGTGGHTCTITVTF
jgi:hypothetical protein